MSKPRLPDGGETPPLHGCVIMAVNLTPRRRDHALTGAARGCAEPEDAGRPWNAGRPAQWMGHAP
jgi:hypothetical protein